jgi:hypothetical protein
VNHFDPCHPIFGEGLHFLIYLRDHPGDAKRQPELVDEMTLIYGLCRCVCKMSPLEWQNM